MRVYVEGGSEERKCFSLGSLVIVTFRYIPAFTPLTIVEMRVYVEGGSEERKRWTG